MIIITGAAGFIGSCMVQKLNDENITDLILVDDFTKSNKKQNWETKQYVDKIQRNDFFRWANINCDKIDFIIHLGARTDTTEFDESIFNELNLGYSQQMWELASRKRIPLIYASSAATYGNGEFGYSDDEKTMALLNPLNPYGKSKLQFDQWVMKQGLTPPLWAGFRFFNVYGPNEYHKGRMSSVIFHAYNQINESGTVKLFRSHHSDYKDGEQLRDFVYVKDVLKVIRWFMEHNPQSGIYNLGTGYARTFNALVEATFSALHLPTKIEYIDMPEDIRNKYQYYTQAKINKLKALPYKKSFTSLENGVKDYVTHYLAKNRIY